VKKQELAREVGRRIRRLRVFANLALAGALGPPIFVILVVFQPRYRPEEQGWLILTLEFSAFVLPLLFMAMFLKEWTAWAIRCPHCHAPLGREKKKAYDVTTTGICRACGKGVIDETA
jgi:hypothetical protein